jgi:hypothetical protein
MTMTEVTGEHINKLQETTVIHAEVDAKPGRLNTARTLQNFNWEGKRSTVKGQTQIVEHFQSLGSL